MIIVTGLFLYFTPYRYNNRHHESFDIYLCRNQKTLADFYVDHIFNNPINKRVMG